MPTGSPSHERCVAAAPLAHAVARLAAGTPYKLALEELLAALDPRDADAAMMLLKESRGAFVLVAPAVGGGAQGDGGGAKAAPRSNDVRGAPGPPSVPSVPSVPDASTAPRALFIGDPLSGTPVALATLGYHVTLLDRDPLRLAFARARGAAYVPGRTAAVCAGADGALPVRDGAFELVVQEGGLPGPRTGYGHGPAELRRVSRGALIVTADNRFGYKRATGQRGRFVRDPRVLVREALAPTRGERGLAGTRRAVRGDLAEARAFALYPHAREFSHVVALDAPRPRLTIGRRERENVVKLLGQRLGLFPWLTPSFAVVAARRRGPTALDRLLDQIAAATGEPRPVADVLIATRSNDAIVHTALPGRGEDDPTGRWTLHVPLQPNKERMAVVHHGWLVELRRTHPGVPVPEPLFLGPLELGPLELGPVAATSFAGSGAEPCAGPRAPGGGVTVAVERRLPGMTGADLTGDRTATARMFREVVDAVVGLVRPGRAALDAARFERVIGARARVALAYVPGAATRRALTRLVDEARECMLGHDLPDALYHADLRAKHVAVREDGGLVGLLDWGASERSFVPYVDVLHLVLHQRKQETGGSFGAAWALVREPGRLAPHEAEALDRYVAAVGLHADVRRGIETLYPVFVAGMAERNWDYSRPDWVHRQFGL